MNDSLAISVNNVSKKYRLFGSVKERFFEALHPFDKKYHHEFWALKDVSFDVPKGSTVGIIGRNGSGKSTLLQIISSILQPTSGSVEVNGKISALLELGSGFNMDLTGRENAIFQGELMGFTRKEMKARLPVIEEFADIGEFMDQPVKIYSSGMFVRLAFAAAINVDPDILIIDEALAVGDAKFQNKCYRKFREFKDAGKTIILVTHDMAAIVRQCDYAVLLENGCAVKKGEPKQIVNYYFEIISGVSKSFDKSTGKADDKNEGVAQDALESARSREEDNFFSEDVSAEDLCPQRPSYNRNEHRYGDRRGSIIDFLILSNGKRYPLVVESDERVDIYMKTRFVDRVEKPNYGIKIKTKDGLVIYAANAIFHNIDTAPVNQNQIVIYKFSLKLSLADGDYFIDMGVGDKSTKVEGEPIDRRYELIHLNVRQKSRFDGIVDLKCSITECRRQEKRLTMEN